jgi:hypothetical protein
MAKKSQKYEAASEGSSDAYVPFTEFGLELVKTLVSAKMLAFQLAQAIPKFIAIPNIGTARLFPGAPVELTSDDENCEISYQVRLKLEIDALRHAIQCKATPTLTLNVLTFAPATLFGEIAPVDADEIVFDNENWNLEGVSALAGAGIGAWFGGPIGAAAGGAAGIVAGAALDVTALSLFIRTQIASQINGKVKESLTARMQDLAAMVPESKVDANPERAVNDGDAVPAVSEANAIDGLIYPGETHTYGIQLLAGARAQ